MTPLAPRLPQRPLIWPDVVRDLQDTLADVKTPVYIVGGAVRDAYLHRPVYDLDLAVPDNAIGLARQIANRLNGDIFIMDYDRDVARVLKETPAGKQFIDVAGFRGIDLLADLIDRDFTINAMAVNLKSDLEHLIDPLDGERDLSDKIIRRCSEQSLFDDPIRALRAIRQSVQFNARIEPETLADVREAAARLLDISPERIRDELIKLLAVSRPAAALRVTDTVGLLKMIVPEAGLLHGVQHSLHTLDAWQHTLLVIEKLHGLLTTISPVRTEHTAAAFDFGMAVMALDRFRSQLQQHIATTWANDRPHQALLMLAALLHDVGSREAAYKGPDFPNYTVISANLAEERAVELRLSNDEKEWLVLVIRHHPEPLAMPDHPADLEMHRFWRKLGTAGIDVCLLAMADYLGILGSDLNQDEWLRIVERIRLLLDAYFNRFEQVVSPPLLVDGNQLMEALDLKPGKHIGLLLDRIREGQVTGEIKSVEDALQAARTALDNLSV